MIAAIAVALAVPIAPVMPASIAEAAALAPAPIVTGIVTQGAPAAIDRQDGIDTGSKPAQIGTRSKHPPATPNILGDWWGLRSRAVAHGITPVIQYVGVGLANLSGGQRHDASYTDQFAIGATVDLKRAAGLPGTAQVTISKRRGPHLVTLAGLGMQLSPQETYGRGEVWRVSQAWYRINQGAIEAKIGRMTLSEDYSVLRCDFASLYLCGGHNGQVASNVWYNFPVSSWGARVRYSHKSAGFLQGGIYQVNPNDIDPTRNLYVGFRGGRAVNIPVELTLTPKVGPARLPGIYRIGAWYSNAEDKDAILDRDGGFRQQTGRGAMLHRGQTGWYAAARQQLIPPGPDGRGDLSVFMAASFFTRDTATLERIVGTGLNLSGPFRGRPRDEIGIGIGNSRRNDRITDMQRTLVAAGILREAPSSNEWLAECYYGWNVMPGLILRPDAQLVIHPGGRSDRKPVVLTGFKTIANF